MTYFMSHIVWFTLYEYFWHCFYIIFNLSADKISAIFLAHQQHFFYISNIQGTSVTSNAHQQHQISATWSATWVYPAIGDIFFPGYFKFLVPIELIWIKNFSLMMDLMDVQSKLKYYSTRELSDTERNFKNSHWVNCKVYDYGWKYTIFGLKVYDFFAKSIRFYDWKYTMF